MCQERELEILPVFFFSETRGAESIMEYVLLFSYTVT